MNFALYKGRHEPVLKKRTLENYPMPRGKGDALQSVIGQQVEKREYLQRMSRIRMDSGSLTDYSKQMFDFSVRTTASRNGCGETRRGKENDVCSRRGSEQSKCRPQSNTRSISSGRTGPTADGSILHNPKQKVLNNIRLRSYKEVMDEKRPCSGVSLFETIKEKHRNYRVLSVPCEWRPQYVPFAGTRQPIENDVIFVPYNAYDNSDFSSYNADIRRPTLDTALSEYDEFASVASHDPFDDNDAGSESIGGEFRPFSQSSRPDSSAMSSAMLPPTTPCSIRLVSLDEDTTSSESENDVVPDSVESLGEPPATDGKKLTKKHSTPNAWSRVSEKKTLLSRLSLKAKGSSVNSGVPPKPVKKIQFLSGPHCWVDDASVTSDESEVEPEKQPEPVVEAPPVEPAVENSSVDNKSEKKGKGKGKRVSSAKSKRGKKGKSAASEKAPPKEEILAPVQKFPVLPEVIVPTPEPEIKVEEVVEEEIREPTLPTFICPTSEKKSREAAIKDWIASTSFQTDHRYVPIV